MLWYSDGLIRIYVAAGKRGYLRVVPLALQLQLEVQQQNARRAELLRLLLEARVGERLLERHAVDQRGVRHAASRHLLDPDQVEVQVGVQHRHRVDDHFGEVFAVRANQLRVQRRSGYLLQHRALLSGVRLRDGDRHRVQTLDRLAERHADASDDHLRVHALIDEVLGRLQDLRGQQNHRRRPVTHLRILGLSNVHQGLCGGMDDIEQLHNARSIV